MMITIQQAMEMSGLPYYAIYNLCRNEDVACICSGVKYYLNREAFEHYLKNGRKPKEISLELKNLDVRQLVKRSGLTYRQIAKEMGITYTYLSRLMRTELSDCNKARMLDAIEKLSGRNDVDADLNSIKSEVESETAPFEDKEKAQKFVDELIINCMQLMNKYGYI